MQSPQKVASDLKPMVQLIDKILIELKRSGVTTLDAIPEGLPLSIALNLDPKLVSLSVSDMLYLFGRAGYDETRAEIVQHGIRANGEETNDPDHVVGLIMLEDFKIGKRQYIRDMNIDLRDFR
jgi:hypothetical protein